MNDRVQISLLSMSILNRLRFVSSVSDTFLDADYDHYVSFQRLSVSIGIKEEDCAPAPLAKPVIPSHL